jgi:hypothetical protein
LSACRKFFIASPWVFNRKNIAERMLPSQCCGLFTVCLQKYDKAAVAIAGLPW